MVNARASRRFTVRSIADRWSCGRVLLYFLDESLREERLLWVIGGELKARMIPSGGRRCVNGRASRTWESRPVDDILKVEGKDMEPPKPKKPSLSGCPGVAFVFVAEPLVFLWRVTTTRASGQCDRQNYSDSVSDI